MPWKHFEYERPSKHELKANLGIATFYTDHNVERAIVEVLRFLK